MDARANLEGPARARGASISHRAAEVIRDAIFAGKLQPGESLPESQLTHDLGVSQTSVREALLSLERSGLVVRIPNKGTSVTRLTEEELREKAAVYALLESAAGVEAAGKLSQDDFEQLEYRRQGIDQSSRQGSLRSLREADLEFHRSVWRCAGNAVLYTTLDQLAVPMFALAKIFRADSADQMETGPWSHSAIMSALRSCDQEQIVQAVSAHATWSFLNAEISGFQILR